MSGDDPFHHVRDYPYFELPMGIHVPTPRIPMPEFLGGGEFVVTKFMILQVLAAVIVFVIFTVWRERFGMASPPRGGSGISGKPSPFCPRSVVRPTIGDHSHDDHGHGDHGHDEHGHAGHGAHGMQRNGHEKGEYHHPADKYLPFIWGCFFYVLICNLLGAVPFLGSATGELNVTFALAITAFSGDDCLWVQSDGPAGFFKNMMPDTVCRGPLACCCHWGFLRLRFWASLLARCVGRSIVCQHHGWSHSSRCDPRLY